MPQLSPSPWFPMLVMTWMFMAGPLLLKVLTTPLYSPPSSPPILVKQNTSPWNWPWP